MAKLLLLYLSHIYHFLTLAQRLFISFVHFHSSGGSRSTAFVIMSCCAFDCMCFTRDKEKQMLGLVCFNKQSGCCPCMLCNHDDDGMCWGCVCCGCQIDPCWGPRNLTNLCCIFMPCCGNSLKILLFKLCCCNNREHGHNDKDTDGPTKTTQNPSATH